MLHLTSGAIGVDQGTTPLFSHVECNGEMWTGEGDREIRCTIPFSTAFRAPPAVHLSLALFDLDQMTNPRAELRAEAVTETGFEAVFHTWADTRIARITVSWMAIGALASEDDWDLD